MGKTPRKDSAPAATREEARASVLHARAVALAVRDEDAAGAAGMEVLEFAVGDESYAFETALVSEVYPVGDVAPIPGTPDFVLGVLSVRGSIVSVLDLRPLFGAPVTEGRMPRAVIVLRSEAMELAVAADAIREVRRLPCEAVRQSPATLAVVREEYVIGVTPERVVVLDAARLLSDPRLIVRHGAESTATTMEGSA